MLYHLVDFYCRHTGDLGNVIENSAGAVSTTITDSVISLVSTDNGYIIGRAVVVSLCCSIFCEIKSCIEMKYRTHT